MQYLWECVRSLTYNFYSVYNNMNDVQAISHSGQTIPSLNIMNAPTATPTNNSNDMIIITIIGILLFFYYMYSKVLNLDANKKKVFNI